MGPGPKSKESNEIPRTYHGIPGLYLKYFSIKLSQKIDLFEFIKNLGEITDLGIGLGINPLITKGYMIDGSDLASALLKSMLTDEPVCPECEHEMDLHSFEPSSIRLAVEEEEHEVWIIVCKVPGCLNTEGIQGQCFTSQPDEIIISVEDEK